jgi:hypothetical protein
MGYLLRFPTVVDFEVSGDGRHVQALPVSGQAPAAIENLYLNQILPLALSRQGKLVLHASAVAIAGKGIVFAGPSGRGKSTLAASFAISGCGFLTDDDLLVEPVDGMWHLISSHPSIRLWEDSHDSLFTASTQVTQTLGFTTKKKLLADSEMIHCDEPQPLHGMYFLGAGRVDSLTIERLRPADALFELAGSAFGLDITAHDRLARHFEQLSKLADLPIHYRLDYPRRYEDLPRVREAIIRLVNGES